MAYPAFCRTTTVTGPGRHKRLLAPIVTRGYWPGLSQAVTGPGCHKRLLVPVVKSGYWPRLSQAVTGPGCHKTLLCHNSDNEISIACWVTKCLRIWLKIVRQTSSTRENKMCYNSRILFNSAFHLLVLVSFLLLLACLTRTHKNTFKRTVPTE